MPAIDSIPLLLAEVWEVAVGIIFFVLYGIGQLVSARDQAKKKPAQRPRPHPPQAPVGQAQGGDMPAPRPVGQEEALRREVEDFLRRAQGKPPKQEQPARQQPKPQPREQSPSRPVAERARAESKPHSRPGPSVPSTPATNLRSEGVAEHVAKHLSSRSIAEHAEHLGDKLEMTDERLEARLHAKFDHQLGSLQRQQKPSGPEQQESNVAAEIAALLRKPGGMRQLIVAQEILRRPER